MADNLTKKQRKLCMSNIRSKWTLQEKKVHKFLLKNKINHKMHPCLIGKPDLLLPRPNEVVFIHGCFWHKCPKHFVSPKSNKTYWDKKIQANVRRFAVQKRKLRKEGYSVVVVWEHEIKADLEKAMTKLLN